jgi:hypothetical protein
MVLELMQEELEEMKAKAQMEREMLDSMRKKIDSVSKKYCNKNFSFLPDKLESTPYSQ